ncbi:cyclic pyranopterin monophosphate synthase MoaC [Thermodesulfobacteriota bacterium]
MSKLSHLGSDGAAAMVDVGDKPATRRLARASALVKMAQATLEAIREGNLPKGEVFGAARIAGIMAAKRVYELIPLAHPLPIDHVTVNFHFVEEGVRVETEAGVTARTGVEMEALMAASVSALTIYDMAKAVDRGMAITDVRLDHKSGGRSGTWDRKEPSE